MLHLSPRRESFQVDDNFDVFGSASPDNAYENEDSECITSADLIRRMKILWTNEKLSPDLLPFDDAIVDAVVAQINSMESALEARIAASKGKSAYADIPLSLHSSEVARIRFILTDYHRIRIGKIESFIHYVLERDQQQQFGDMPLLSEGERNFALRMKEATETYFQSSFLETLPPTIQDVPFKNIGRKPDLDTYVFFRVEKSVSATDFSNAVLENGGSATEIGDGLSLSAGDQHVMLYKNIASLLKSGAVTLLS